MSDRLKKGYLQWRCRRGTKELDLLLSRFLDSQYQQLSDNELLIFDDLLNSQDTDLWYYLSGQSDCTLDKHSRIIAKINANN